MNGEFDGARSRCLRVKEILVELGARLDANSTSIEASRVEILAGDLVAAETLLRRDDAASQGDRRAVLPVDDRCRFRLRSSRCGALSTRRTTTPAWRRSSPTRTTSGRRYRGGPRARRCWAHRGGSLDDAIAHGSGAPSTWRRDSGDIEMRADALTELGRVYTIAGLPGIWQGLPGGRPWNSEGQGGPGGEPAGQRAARRPHPCLTRLPELVPAHAAVVERIDRRGVRLVAPGEARRCWMPFLPQARIVSCWVAPLASVYTWTKNDGVPLKYLICTWKALPNVAPPPTSTLTE